MNRMLPLLVWVGTSFAAGPTFDVASLKPSPPIPLGQYYNANLGTARFGEVTLSNATLVDCIKFAWGLASDEQVSGPDWTRSKEVRFDVVAKAPPNTAREQLLLMLQTLLTERFHLEMHAEKKALFHYAMEVGKNGPKLRDGDPDPAKQHMTYRTGHIAHNEIRMPVLAMLLSRQLRELVLDRTGLTGVYEIDLQWIPQPRTGEAGSAEPEKGPDVFAAVQDQLGLKLQRSKDPVEVLVIDRANREPVSN